jgi:5-(carboxyamino)imidazole ribonucleotide synthase
MLPSLIHPSKPTTIGILGGGQLAKMMASEAFRMGLRVAVIEHGEDSPAGMMTHLEYPLGWNDAEELTRFVEASDVVTLENEFIDPAIVEQIEERRAVFPSSATLRLIQDKYIQKQTMSAAGIPVPVFAALESVEQMKAFGAEHGWPYVVKTRKFGYDGYGNATVRMPEHCDPVWKRFRNTDSPRDLMGESFVPFVSELAVMVARNRRGELAVYPCVETVQQNHICRLVVAPARIPQEVHQHAQELAVAAVEAIGGVGVFGVELFLLADNSIVFNEIAPRPHNSGHYTIEGCHTSQFENAIRAVVNLPLGSPEMRSPAAAMLNLLGMRNGPGVPDSVVDLMRHASVKLHLYGKKDSRIGRKMGHLTAVANTPEEAVLLVEEAEKDLIW